MLEKYKINSDELLFITVILLIQEGEVNPYINLYFSLPSVCRGGIRDILVSLQKKQIITKEYTIPPSGRRPGSGECIYSETSLRLHILFYQWQSPLPAD